MKEVGLYIMMHILKYTFVIGILSGFYIHELLKKMSITVLMKIRYTSIPEMSKRQLENLPR